MQTKGGDISISFEMIFSVIIIIAVIGASSYALYYFLNFKNCSQVGLFYRDFQDSVDKAWNADIVKTTYVGDLPSSIQKVCIGNLSSADQSIPEYKSLRNYVIKEANVFLYPGQKACDIPYANIKHAKIEGFSCKAVHAGSVTFNLDKADNEALVRIS